MGILYGVCVIFLLIIIGGECGFWIFVICRRRGFMGCVFYVVNFVLRVELFVVFFLGLCFGICCFCLEKLCN